MLILGKRFREFDPRVIGMIGAVIVAVALVLALSAGGIQRSLTSEKYTALFEEAGGLSAGAEVRIGGLNAGEVESVTLEGGHVRVEFTVEGSGTLGEQTGAAIKTATPLGVKMLTVLPAGEGQLEPGSEIPVERTNAPYDLAGVLGDLTEQTEQLDTNTLSEALDTVSTTLRDTPEELRTTLDGLNRLATSVTEQDQQLRALLERSNNVTATLAARNRELSQLFDQGNLLLEELNSRQAIITELLHTTNATVRELRGLVSDNQEEIQPALNQLQGVVDLLNQDKQLLATMIQGMNMYAGTLGESVGGGPWFYGFIPNLPPTNIAPYLHNVLGRLHP